ncbi:hypothetical protein [Paracoccus sp. SSK6]|uniref:hypothetical protein n=1 Tax=Paracoccus sp. SSK6 TaxID=3143131 RepID=UPI00321BA019
MALSTGVKLAVAKLVRDGKSVNTHIEDIKAQGVAYARQSVPDAIEYLKAQFDRLLDLAESKIDESVPFIEMDAERRPVNVVLDGKEAATFYAPKASLDQLEMDLSKVSRAKS